MVALPAETTWASGKPQLARARLEQPVKVSAAAASRTPGEHPHRAGTGAEETGLAIARLQTGAWAQETAALFPAPPVAVRLEPAVHGALPALAAGALVAAVAVAAGEGVDSPTDEG